MEQFFVIEYHERGLTKYEVFEYEDEAKERIKDLFEEGNDCGVRLHHCVTRITYATEMAVKYIPEIERDSNNEN